MTSKITEKSAPQISEGSLADLTHDPKNARKHTPENVGVIADSLGKVGAARSIVIDEDNVVLAGNATVDAAGERGMEKVVIVDVDGNALVAVRRKGLTPEQKLHLALSDNRAAELAGWNPDVLLAIKEEGLVDLRGMFSEDSLEKILAKAEARELEGDPDAIPEPPDDPITKKGDLWILGDHRLLCGDSSSPTDLDRLLAGVPVDMVNTDPPYNVKVEPRSNNAIAAGNSSFAKAKPTHHQKLDLARHPEKATPTGKMRAKDRPLENDFVTDEAFDAMLNAWFGNIGRTLRPGGAFYVWGGYANVSNYPGPLKAAQLYFSQAIIWVKGHPVLTRKDFMGNHEWCFYGWKEGAAHRYFGPNNATDVWEVKKVTPTAMVHLTEKPVELARMAIEYSSLPAETVLDLFGGSGSTMIGCEITRRKGRLMEIDPAYCDVIVQRWEGLTGGKAELEARP